MGRSKTRLKSKPARLKVNMSPETANAQTNFTATDKLSLMPASSLSNKGRAQMFATIQRKLGNSHLSRLMNTVQRNVDVSHPDDPHEKEAEAVASEITAEPKVKRLFRAISKTSANQTKQFNQQAEPESLQKRSRSGAAEGISDEDVEARLNSPGGGRPLPDKLKDEMGYRMGADFSHVRVHDSAEDKGVATRLKAKAFAYGGDIWLGEGASVNDRKLMAHELTHVVQQSCGRIQPFIQRSVVPEDVSSEMIGLTFELTASVVTGGKRLAKGTKIVIKTWDNAKSMVTAQVSGSKSNISVEKTVIRPVNKAVTGMHPYHAGIGGQSAAVIKSEKQLADWIAGKSAYKSKKALTLYEAERKRLEKLLKSKQKVLNRRLIQQAMFNRFDNVIKKEVAAANKAHSYTGKDTLDPNLMKSMVFQETQMGTSGRHLEVPPTHVVKTRFNLAQVIDSSGMALLTLMEAEKPALITTYKLGDLRKDLENAKKRYALLKKKTTRTPAEQAELTQLNSLSRQYWEVFIWSYSKSPGYRFADAVNALFASSTPALNVDYKFWIHIAVMWLFKKHRKGRSWAETIRAYNGSGARARHYRDAVLARAKAAATAAKSGKEYVPGKI